MKSMELKAYEILKDKLDEEKATVLLGFAQEKFDEQKDVFLTKDDKVELIARMKDDKIDLISRMKDDKVGLIKWMVGFWIAQIAAILGLYLKK